MKRLFAASRSLLPVVVLTVVAAMCTAPLAHAASSASAGRMSPAASRGPAASGTQCNFVQSLKACKSTDPTVAYTSHAYGDTANCSFLFDITWGDGGSITKAVNDPTDGNHLLADHTYTAPKVYTITVTITVTAGDCTVTNSAHSFTLLVAKQVVPVPAGTAHVKGHVVYNYRVSGKKVSAALLTPACALAIAKFDITHAVVESIIDFVPTGFGKVAVLVVTTVYDAGELLNACVPTKLKQHVK